MDLKGFVNFLVENNAFQVGEFVLKDGRKSPYFINTGAFKSGKAIAELGKYYATKIHEEFGKDVDVVFGPAYKGIPLAVATATELYGEHQTEVGYCFNRKEEKAHGDRGGFIGVKPEHGQRIVIVDDVITSGGTKREAVEMLKNAADVEVLGVVVLVDREEKLSSGKTAIQEFEEQSGIRIIAIARITDMLEFLGRGDSARIRKHLEMQG